MYSLILTKACALELVIEIYLSMLHKTSLGFLPEVSLIRATGLRKI